MNSVLKATLVCVFVLTSTFSFSVNRFNELNNSSISTISEVFIEQTDPQFDAYKSQVEKYTANSNYDAIITLSKKVLDDGIIANEKEFILLQIANSYFNKKDYTNTYKYLNIAEESLDTLNTYNNYQLLGDLYTEISEYQRAITIYNKALEHHLNNDNKEALADLYLSIGDLNNKTNNYDEALINYNKSLEISNLLNDYRSMSSAYNNITTIEIRNKDYKSALTKLLKSKELLIKADSDDKIKYAIDYNIASVYVSLNEFDKAQKILEKVKNYAKIEDTNLLPYVLVAEADIYENKENYTSAIDKLKQALILSESNKNENLQSKILLRLSTLNENLNNFNKALDYYQEHVNLRDSINSKITNQDINTIQEKFKISEYKKDLEIQKQEIEILEIESNNTKYIALILGLLTLGLILFIYRQYRIISIKKKNEFYVAEITKLKEENHAKEVDLISKQATDFAMQIQEQNSMLISIKNKINTALKKPATDKWKSIKDITFLINSKIALNNEKVQLNTTLKEYADGFLTKLNKEYPDLNEKEIKVCTLIRLNYETKQIANQLGIAEHSIHNYRYNIRKKLELDKSTPLNDFLKQL